MSIRININFCLVIFSNRLPSMGRYRLHSTQICFEIKEANNPFWSNLCYPYECRESNNNSHIYCSASFHSEQITQRKVAGIFIKILWNQIDFLYVIYITAASRCQTELNHWKSSGKTLQTSGFWSEGQSQHPV